MIAQSGWPWHTFESDDGTLAADLLYAPASRQALDYLLAIQMRLELATQVPVSIYGPIGQILPGISPARPRGAVPGAVPIKDLLTAQQWPRRIGQVLEVTYKANLHLFLIPMILNGVTTAQIVLGPLQLFEPGTPGDGAVGSGPLPGKITPITGAPILASWRARAAAEIASMLVRGLCTPAPQKTSGRAQDTAVGVLSDQATTIMPSLGSAGRLQQSGPLQLGPLAQDAALPDASTTAWPQRLIDYAKMTQQRQVQAADPPEEHDVAPAWPLTPGFFTAGISPDVTHQEPANWPRNLIEAMPQAVIISAAPAGQVVLANRAARRLWPRLLGGQEPMGASSASHGLRISTDQYPPEWQGLILALRQGAGLYRAEISIEVAEGDLCASSQEPLAGQAAQRPPSATDTIVRASRQRPFLVSAFPLHNTQGIASHAVAIFEDLSGLVDRELFKDELLLVAAHDARNPLTLISSYAQFLERNLALEISPGPALEYARGRLAEIQEQVQVLTRLTDQLYTVTRLQSAQQRPRVEAFNLARILQRAAIDQQILTPGHTIETAIEHDPCLGYGDPVQVQQILMHLLKNAVRYSHPTKPIRISLRCTPENNPLWAEISIRDQGIGIPRANLPHIFERFYQSRDDEQRARMAGLSRPTGESTNLGLGLYLCKQLIEHIGGRIWADSAESKGTTIAFTVPLKR